MNATALSSSATLQALRGRAVRPHEASFYFHDSSVNEPAVKVLPGEYFVGDAQAVIVTTLGSCVAACLHDPGSGLGGLNHFMLPDGASDASDAGGRFGAFAMELLINELLKRGARRSSMQAKIFGGGQVMRSLAGTCIGERNVAFVRSFLAQEGIPILANDVLGIWPRKVCQFPATGQVLCKRLPATHGHEYVSQEERYRAELAKLRRGGDVELFS